MVTCTYLILLRACLFVLKYPNTYGGIFREIESKEDATFYIMSNTISLKESNIQRAEKM